MRTRLGRTDRIRKFRERAREEKPAQKAQELGGVREKALATKLNLNYI